MLALAGQLRSAGRLEAARGVIDAYRGQRPDDMQGRYLSALIRLDLDDPDRAEEVVRPLLGLPSAAVHHLAGLIAREHGNAALAERRLRRALVFDPAHPGARQAMVRLLPSADRGVEWAAAAVVVEPRDASAWSDLAFAVLLSGRSAVPARVAALLAGAPDDNACRPAADVLDDLLRGRGGQPGGEGWVGWSDRDLLSLLDSLAESYRAHPDAIQGFERRFHRAAVCRPDLRISWLALLALRSHVGRPGGATLTRAAARVVAFGGMHDSTAASVRPFEACVTAKAITATDVDPIAASRVGHAFGLQAISDATRRPVTLRTVGGRREVAIGGRRVVYARPTDNVSGFTTLLFLFEPGLWRWMAGFHPDDVLLDIGANVGIYSIAAAGLFGVRVAALEPYGPNLEILRGNVAANRLSERVTVLPVAASDVERTGRLFHEGGGAGAAAQHFETAGEDEDEGEAFEQVQGVPVDTLVERRTIPFPTRIKIDVDGNERAVIEGMTRTLADARLHSVRLEVRWHLPAGRAVVERIEAFGFRAAVDDDPKNLLFTRAKFPSKTG